MRIVSIAVVAGIILLWLSCTKGVPNFASTQTGNTATVKMSNGWWVNISLPGLGNLTPTPIFFETYNTASNSPDSMWLDDLDNGYGFKCTTAVNYSALSFSVTNSKNLYVDGNG